MADEKSASPAAAPDDISISAIVKQAQDAQGQMARWDEGKKDAFIGTFHQRANAACYILVATARDIAQSALNRKFISQKHISDIFGKDQYSNTKWGAGLFEFDNNGHYYNNNRRIGGRSSEELDEIATERAKKVLKELPALKEAVRVISPEVAKWIERRDELLDEGQKLWDSFQEEFEEPLKLSDFPKDATREDIELELKTRTRDFRQKRAKMSEIGEEGQELERKINKALYRGLPGLADSIASVCKEYLERAKGMGSLDRRVAEQVKFGDSDAALTLLKQFEQDEATISDKIGAQFKAAMETLKTAVKEGRAKLGPKKKDA